MRMRLRLLRQRANCHADKTVSFLPSAHGTLSAAGGGRAVQDGDTATHGTTIIFTAAPDKGYQVSVWAGDCAGAVGDSCAVAATRNISVSAAFSDIDECAAQTDDCAADGGRCDNTDGGFACSCAAGYSGDGRICRADKTVSFLPSAYGTLSAASGGFSIQDGDTAAHGTTITFTAAPDKGYQVSVWAGDCAGAVGDSCAVAATRNVSVSAAFSDIDECAAQTDDCAADGGRCDNTDGGFACSCAAGYSGDGRICRADKTVSFLPSAHGTLSAAGGGFSIQDGGAAAHGTTITFTAAPDKGYQVSAWAGDCADTIGDSCAVAATLNVSVSAVFSDIDECAAKTDDCAADGGRCDNTDGGFACSCDSGYSGDGRTCEADMTVSFRQSAHGTLFAAGGGFSIQDGDTAPRGTTIIFIAAPDKGYQISAWLGDCAGTVGDSCAVAVTGNVSVGAIFNENPCSSIDGASKGANENECVCKTDGHLIFGEAPNRVCAPPTVCPKDYARDDCVPNGRDPKKAYQRDACHKLFGGVTRTAADDHQICTKVDLNGTFCIVGSRDAFPCRGLFNHIFKCNQQNRPALNPFFCAAPCEGSENIARGRQCGKKTAAADGSASP